MRRGNLDKVNLKMINNKKKQKLILGENCISQHYVIIHIVVLIRNMSTPDLNALSASLSLLAVK